MLCYGPINVKPRGGGGHGGGHLIDFSLLTFGNFILWWEYFDLKHTNLENALVMHGLIPTFTILPSYTHIICTFFMIYW